MSGLLRETEVIFQPSGRRVFVLPGTVILEAAARAGFIIDTPCGGAGTCGKCRVKIVSGSCEPTAVEQEVLGDKLLAEGIRLACQAQVGSEVTVEVPSESLFETHQRILETSSQEDVDIQPAIIKKYRELSPPTQEDPDPDERRLSKAVGEFTASVRVLRKLPSVMRSDGFKVTAVLAGERLIDVESGDTTAECRGLAFDIGTTTIVGTLIDLKTGNDLAVASTVNPQVSFGDDVISRITMCREKEGGLAEMRSAVLGAVAGIVDEVISKADVSRESIYAAVFAGNTTMQHIFCGVDPSSLGEMPFVPVCDGGLSMRAEELGMNINPLGRAYVFPQIGGFVGGDTVAGVVACRLESIQGSSLLVDIGTNGELVLSHDGKMIATSVAAGPAFEGARIMNGMRATAGAIEKVVMDGDVGLNVIGNAPPTGICGTGLVDAVAEMLRIGVLDQNGRIQSPDEITSASDAIRARLVDNEGQFDFILSSADDSGTGSPICIHQKDVRELQLANGAIRAGANILMKMAGITVDELDAVLLAGAFGNFIRRRNARRIGMLPMLPTGKIRYIGNAASFGAKRALLSTEEMAYSADVVSRIEHVDLSLDPEFQLEFGSAMIFPGSEADDC